MFLFSSEGIMINKPHVMHGGYEYEDDGGICFVGKNENNTIPSDVDMVLEGDSETYTCKLETYMFLFFRIPDSVIVYLVRNVRRPTTVFP